MREWEGNKMRGRDREGDKMEKEGEEKGALPYFRLNPGRNLTSISTVVIDSGFSGWRWRAGLSHCYFRSSWARAEPPVFWLESGQPGSEFLLSNFIISWGLRFFRFPNEWFLLKFIFFFNEKLVFFYYQCAILLGGLKPAKLATSFIYTFREHRLFFCLPF